MKKFLLNIVLILMASVSTYSQEVGDTLWTYNFNKEWSHINSALFSPDGQWIYANADYQGSLFTYKFSLEGKIIEKINNLKSGIHQFSKDGKFFWTDSLDKYDAITFKKVDSLKNHNLKSKIYKWIINEDLNIGLIVHGFEAHSLKDKHFEIFDPKTMTVTQLIQNPDSTARMWDIDISSDGKYIALSIDKAVADGVNERVVSNRVEVWDAQELKPIKVLIEEGKQIEILSVKLSSDSKYLIAKGFNYMNLYTIDKLQLQYFFDFYQSKGKIRSCLFSIDNKYLYYVVDKAVKFNLMNLKEEKEWLQPNSSNFLISNQTNDKLLCTNAINSTLYLLDNRSKTSVLDSSQERLLLVNQSINDYIEIHSTYKQDLNLTYNITNINGKRMRTSNINIQSNSKCIITKLELSDGVYFFNTEINGQNYHLKFIKD
jgi:hypothetical protein